jgi:hypothetical protein
MEEEKELMGKIPYDSAIESLMYGTVCTRQDIDHAIRVVSKFMSNTGKAHYEAIN